MRKQNPPLSRQNTSSEVRVINRLEPPLVACPCSWLHGHVVDGKHGFRAGESLDWLDFCVHFRSSRCLEAYRKYKADA